MMTSQTLSPAALPLVGKGIQSIFIPILLSVSYHMHAQALYQQMGFIKEENFYS